MDSPRSSQPSSLDSLRTVEFRQTLRGYHIDDVDEYLERVAVDAEALQEQLRQSNERLRPAAERVAQLEKLLAEAKEQAERAEQAAASAPTSVGHDDSSVTDDTLQRTLVLAQRFVDETKSEAEMQARDTISKAEERARILIAEAEGRARSVTADTERKLRDEVARLESLRTDLSNDVDRLVQHLDNERNRLRGTLGEMLTWVDRHIQPGSSPLGGISKSDVNGERGSQDADRGRGATTASTRRAP